jgi:hypothetical protein
MLGVNSVVLAGQFSASVEKGQAIASGQAQHALVAKKREEQG